MQAVIRTSLLTLAVLGAVTPVEPRLVEGWYSTGLYPWIQALLTPVTNLVPFAVLDLVTIAAAIWLVVTVVRAWRARRGKQRWAPLGAMLARVVTVAAVVYLFFLGLWGLNYRRLGMTDRIVTSGNPARREAVIELGSRAVERLNALHTPAHAQGWRTAPWRDHGLRSAYERVQQALSDSRPAVPGRLKRSLYGPFFRWAGVDGMVNPFGLEVIGNPDLLGFEQPFVAAHEWAHLAGYADESEASFVGWLTCVNGPVPAAYSGWLFLYWQISGEVARSDHERLASALHDGPRSDLAAVADRLRRGQIPFLRDASWQVYDQYLKANRVEEGVRSYGQVVTLLVQARFTNGWMPVRR